MLEQKDYKQVARVAGSIGNTVLGVSINVAGLTLSPQDDFMVRQYCEEIYLKIFESQYMNDPENIRDCVEMRECLLGRFPTKIYAERIPNEYSNDAWGKMRPWYLVTTERGKFKIGWRKRVIVLDWSQSDIKFTAEELFPNENVTKEGRMIHADGYEKVQEYIETILDS